MGDHRTISIADQIFELLERDILSGKYSRGEVLSELRLSEELGVSRTPVREAIRRLEQENILEDTGRGAVVVGISKEDMQDMYEIRSRIEDMAAARAAKNITDEQLAEYVGAIIANQSADVDIVSGATVDCQAIGTAIGQAFAK